MTLKTIIITIAGLIPLTAPAITDSPYHAIVAADGSGDYRTVNDAITAAPTGLTSPWRILVKSGDYDEHIVIPADKPYIHLIGQGKNSTAIRHKLNHGQKAMESGRFDNSAYWDYSYNNPDGKCARMD